MRQEVMLLKKFPHPLFIKCFDAFRDKDDNAYLVTEFAESSDLMKDMTERFRKGKKYSDKESQNIIL